MKPITIETADENKVFAKRSASRSHKRQAHASCVRESAVAARRRRMTERVTLTEAESSVLAEAKAIIDRRLFARQAAVAHPREAADFLKLALAQESVEVFCALFLDTRHRILAFCPLFRGTIDGCSVHPRGVVQQALRYNAAAVILAHNHPSGIPEPSAADIALTRRLTDALGLLDVRVLDHFIIGAGEPVSLAERGLM